MEAKRRIIVPAIQTRKNELIPIWDPRVRYEKSEDYGVEISLEDEYGSQQVVECIYDLKTRQLSMGIEVDLYPAITDLDFQVGEKVYYEIDHQKIRETQVIDILFETFDLQIIKGKKIEGWLKTRVGDKITDPEGLYAIKNWKPVWVLSCGAKTEWSHQLHHQG